VFFVSNIVQCDDIVCAYDILCMHTHSIYLYLQCISTYICVYIMYLCICKVFMCQINYCPPQNKIDFFWHFLHMLVKKYKQIEKFLNEHSVYIHDVTI